MLYRLFLTSSSPIDEHLSLIVDLLPSASTFSVPNPCILNVLKRIAKAALRPFSPLPPDKFPQLPFALFIPCLRRDFL